MPNTDNILHVRIHREPADRIRRAASLRGFTLGDYLTRLQDLHDAARARADAGDDGFQAELESRGLQTVNVSG